MKIVKRIKDAFNFKIRIPKPSLPSISIGSKEGLFGIKVPTFKVNWHAVGGVFTKPAIFGNAGFGDVEEAIVPFEGRHAQRIAGLIANAMPKALSTLQQAVTVVNEIHNHFGTVIADKQGLKKLERMLQKVRIDEQGRLGVDDV